MSGPAPGALFDERSVSWKVMSSRFPLLGGPRAAILQVADPRIAAGVVEFSSFSSDPVGRLRRTLSAVGAVSFGSPELRERTLAGFERAHASFDGVLDDGSAWSANDPLLRWWVVATLIDTVVEVDRRWVGYLDAARRTQFYREQRELGAAFGVPDEVMPPTHVGFAQFMAARFESLEPSADSRRLTGDLLAQPGAAIAGAGWPVEVLTADLLPAVLRPKLGVSDPPPGMGACGLVTRVGTRAVRAVGLSGVARGVADRSMQAGLALVRS